MRRSIALLLALLSLLPLLLTGCGEARREERQIFAMDTVMILTAYGGKAKQGLAAAERTIFALDAALDPEDKNSELYALNAAGGADSLSPDLRSLLELSLEVWQRCGALNVALQPLSRAWGFVGGDYRIPDEAERQALLEKTDLSRVLLEGESLRLPEGMELGFGAVAKGYAAQAALEAMEAEGVSQAILSLGGNVQTLGQTRPDGNPWQVAVQDPLDTSKYVCVLSLGQTAAVTSGGYQRYFEQDGRRWHHILDPRTGMPADSGLLSVTVICGDGAMADALSTALFVLGEQAALDYRAEFGGFDLVLVTEDRRVVVAGEPDTEPCGEDYVFEYLE